MYIIRAKKSISVILALVLLLCAFSLVPVNTSANDSAIYTSSDSMWNYRFVDGDSIGISITCGKNYTAAYQGGQQDVDVPSTIDGYRVTAIGEYAFYGLDNIKSITLPYTVNFVDKYAFALCEGLESIELTNCITEISDYAFFGCKSLDGVTVPETTERIGYRAFYGCSCLNGIELPETLENISHQAFEGSAFYDNAEGELCIGNCFIKADPEAEGNYVIPSEMNIIAGGAFENCENVSQITLPDTLSYISDGAFENCPSLRLVAIPDSVVRVGEFALAECKKLEAIEIGNTVEYIGDGAFEGCDLLESIDISPDNANYASVDGVLYDKQVKQLLEYPASKKDAEYTIEPTTVQVSAYAFRDALYLEKVIFDCKVDTLNNNTFENCKALKTVVLPDTLVEIEPYAFLECPSLTDVEFPEGLKAIGEKAFAYCTALESISFPFRLERVGADAFLKCTSLKNINMNDTYAVFGKGVFKYCMSLEKVKLSDNTVQVNNYMFEHCDSLKEIEFGSSVQIIGESAFKDCVSIEKLEIPESIYIIKKFAFWGCKSLEKIEFSKGIETICEYAFGNCEKLNEIVLAESLEKIGDYAFDKCPSLKELTIPENVETINVNAFSSSGLETIRAYKDTYAEVFAKVYGYEFDSMGYPFRYDANLYEDAWYYDSIEYCVKNGYMRGFEPGDYKATYELQRQDFIVILARVAGAELINYVDSEPAFRDMVKGDYYCSAVNWAADIGLVESEDGIFGVGEFVTREQMALILYRFFGSPEVYNVESTLEVFEDNGDIDDEARKAVAWAIQNSVFSGMSETVFAPKEYAVRAMISKIIMRLDEKGAFDTQAVNAYAEN